MRILDIKLKPWWKFWQIDQFEVTVELDDGEVRNVSIYEMPTRDCVWGEHMFLYYIKNKIRYGRQWGKKKEKGKEEPILSHKEYYESCVVSFIGKEIENVP